MFGYGRKNFTWNGTLRELEGSSPAFRTGRHRLSVYVSVCVNHMYFYIVSERVAELIWQPLSGWLRASTNQGQAEP